MNTPTQSSVPQSTAYTALTSLLNSKISRLRSILQNHITQAASELAYEEKMVEFLEHTHLQLQKATDKSRIFVNKQLERKCATHSRQASVSRPPRNEHSSSPKQSVLNHSTGGFCQSGISQSGITGTNINKNDQSSLVQNQPNVTDTTQIVQSILSGAKGNISERLPKLSLERLRAEFKHTDHLSKNLRSGSKTSRDSPANKLLSKSSLAVTAARNLKNKFFLKSQRHVGEKPNKESSSSFVQNLHFPVKRTSTTPPPRYEHKTIDSMKTLNTISKFAQTSADQRRPPGLLPLTLPQPQKPQGTDLRGSRPTIHEYSAIKYTSSQSGHGKTNSLDNNQINTIVNKIKKITNQHCLE